MTHSLGGVETFDVMLCCEPGGVFRCGDGGPRLSLVSSLAYQHVAPCPQTERSLLSPEPSLVSRSLSPSPALMYFSLTLCFSLPSSVFFMSLSLYIYSLLVSRSLSVWLLSCLSRALYLCLSLSLCLHLHLHLHLHLCLSLRLSLCLQSSCRSINLNRVLILAFNLNRVIILTLNLSLNLILPPPPPPFSLPRPSRGGVL